MDHRFGREMSAKWEECGCGLGGWDWVADGVGVLVT